MKKLMKAIAALMLSMAVICAVGCKKVSNDGGNNNGFYNGHEYVDLGLPSGTLWATCNVGANTPEEYGDYFAWGETVSKTIYNWSNYKYCNGNYDQLTKYCANPDYGYNGYTDELSILLPEDDAATVNWGNGWCMPTADQWRELKDYTITAWTTQNGVDGYLFAASNGSSLFLPAAGYRWGDEIHSAGSIGDYWYSTFGKDYPHRAWSFIIRSGCSSSMYDNYRHWGQSVRAVRSVIRN